MKKTGLIAVSLVVLVTLVFLTASLAIAQDKNQDNQAAAEIDPGGEVGPVIQLQPSNFRWPQAVLWDNGPLVNCAGCGVGGADESVLQNTSLSMNTLGFGHQVIEDNWVADDFTVTDATGWNIDSFTFFAYQSFAGATSTMTDTYWLVYDGQPGAGGMVIASGSGLDDTGWSNIYRVTETTTGGNTDRAIMYDLVDTPALFLPAGTYWLAWQTDGTAASGPWAPPITINGQTTTGNGLQSVDDLATWNPVEDTGSVTQQGFPFIIEGTVASEPDPLTCNAPAVSFENSIPSDWTVVVSTGSVYWSTTSNLDACDNGGNATLGSGEAACADSDETNVAGDPYDTELWSNSFDLSDSDVVSLTFAAAYNDITPAGGDMFQVWVWDGNAWTLELEWDEDHNEIVVLDLAAYAGLSDVGVSYRYFGEGWDWWAQVDDVSLECVTTEWNVYLSSVLKPPADPPGVQP